MTEDSYLISTMIFGGSQSGAILSIWWEIYVRFEEGI